MLPAGGMHASQGTFSSDEWTGSSLSYGIVHYLFLGALGVVLIFYSSFLMKFL